jgi:hypothetical protein
MRYSEFKLVEASGIFNRQPGQMFKHTETGHELEFIEVLPYPSDAGQFKTPEDRDAAVEKINQDNDKTIQWTNNPTAGTLAFGVAYLLDKQDKFYIDAPDNSKPTYTHVFGRYFEQVRQAGLPANWNSKYMMGYRVQTKAATKIVSGLMPQDILGLEEKRYRGIDSLMADIRTNLKEKPEVLAGFETVAQGTLPAEFENQRELATAIRDYAGEILQPIAIMAGANVGPGIEACKQDLIPGEDWSDLELYWPSGKNHALIDSAFVRADGLEIGISSKGKDGADASMKNIMDAINKARIKNPQLLESHPDVVTVCETIDKESAEEGPLTVAVSLGLITENTKKQILDLPWGTGVKNQERITVDNLKALNNPELMTVYESFGARLKHPNYNLYYHMVTNTAKMVAKDLNKDIPFGDGMMAFMQQSSIVQVYTNITQNDNSVSVSDFNSVYPPKFDGRILVNGSKNYASTKIFGKLAFKMPKT